jgi:DNA primase
LEGLIPDEVVDRVRSGTDIVELISEYVSLRRTGANYIGLCPFHAEKTPSFTVSPSKQIFHCFGCGAGGDAVGFGGRTMGDEQPKYLNSPETPLFRKGETLYLLDVASEHIRKRGYSVITEGYFDAIACQTAGVKNAVATLGTALTPGHLRLLGRFSKNVLLVFDSDAAGIKAAERSLDIFLGSGLTAKVALLPAGDDPDSLVRRDGPAALAERLKASEKLIDFVIKRAAANVFDIEGKLAAASLLSGILAKMDNGVERAHYLKRSADVLGVPEAALAEELAKKMGRPGVYRGTSRQVAAASNRIEEELLHIMLHDSEVAAEVASELSADDFTDPSIRAVASVVFGLLEKGVEPGVPKVLDALDDEGLKKLVASLTVRDTVEDVKGYALGPDGAVGKLVAGRVDRLLGGLSSLVRQAEENGEKEEVEELSKLQYRLKVASSKKDFALLNKLQKEFAEWQKRKSLTK